jgi:hypothetical protein
MRAAPSLGPSLPSICLDTRLYRHVQEIHSREQLARPSLADAPVRICIPSSVQALCQECFSGSPSLSTVAFESSSRLSCIRDSVFEKCSSLSSISVPSPLKSLARSVSRTARLSRLSHSHLVPSFHPSDLLHFSGVQHFHPFSFLPLLNVFAAYISVYVNLFRQ